MQLPVCKVGTRSEKSLEQQWAGVVVEEMGCIVLSPLRHWGSAEVSCLQVRAHSRYKTHEDVFQFISLTQRAFYGHLRRLGCAWNPR
jgi:hypothetical protein